MKMKEIGERERGRWDRFVLSLPSPSHSHLYSWRTVLERAYGLKTISFAAEEGGEIKGILPIVLMKGIRGGRFAVSISFTNRGGILARDQGVVPLFLNEGLSLLSSLRLSYIELRQDDPLTVDIPVRIHKARLTLMLPKREEEIWAGLDAKVRNQVRKAERSGLSIAIGGAENLAPFYRVYSENMRDLGTPSHTARFFRAVLDTFREDYRVFLVMKGEEAVGGALFCFFGDRVEVPWASSLRRWLPLCPNMLLYKEMIFEAIRRGATLFDFGRSAKGDGTYRFKLQWGAEPSTLHWYFLSREGEGFPGVDRGDRSMAPLIRLWKGLPLRVANLLSPFLIKRLPG